MPKVATQRTRDRQLTLTLIGPSLLFMALFYLLPLFRVVVISLSEPSPGFSNYEMLATSTSILRVLKTTAWICLCTTAVALLLGYIAAYVMVRTRPSVQRVLFLCVILPLWVSALVRAFAWVMLLRREGFVNTALQTAGLIDQPLELVWNQFGVIIGMTHYMLPYAVLPLYAAMREIDPRTIAAARSLGASAPQIFVRIIWPLSVPGLVSAGVLVFVFSIGFFITPAILGGGKTLMVAEFIRLQIVELLRWGPGTALAIAVTLLVLAALGCVARIVGVQRLLGGSSS